MIPGEVMQIGNSGSVTSVGASSSANGKLAQWIVERFRIARSKRATWDGHWQDIKELVRPDALDFNRQMVPGYRRYDLIYDGTAIDANEELASGLHSFLTSPTERWFELGIEGNDKSYEDDPDALAWLEMVSDLIFCYYAYPPSCFNTTMHEGYLDLGAFGSLVIYQEWSNDHGGHVCFKSYPLADCYYMENCDGMVDTIFRYFTYTGRNIVEEFGQGDPKNLPEKIRKAIESKGGIDREFRIIHHVYPRQDRDVTRLDKKNKRFGSVYISEQTGEVLEEDGYDAFPYTVSRWLKIAGEVYGRGPAMKCLPDIKSLNMMEKVLLKASQKAVDPPIVVPDDGFLLPIKTSPGSIIYKEPGTEKIESLEFKGDLRFGIEYPNQKRDYIRKCFYSEWLKMQKEDKQMTAYEVADRRDEKLRLLAPMLGRQQTELLGPVVARTYQLLRSNGRIPPAPETLHRKKMMVTYISPAARAQKGVKGQAMAQFFQDLVPIAQQDPSVMDAIDMDKAAQMYAIIRGVPRTVMRSMDAIKQIRDQRNQAQQAQQLAQTAEPASKAMLNIAKAQQGGQ